MVVKPDRPKLSASLLGGPLRDASRELYRANRLRALAERKRLMIPYLLSKVEEQDWHGVQDAASDLRDIEAEVKGLEQG